MFLPLAVIGALIAVTVLHAHAQPQPLAAHARLTPHEFQLGVREQHIPGPWTPIDQFAQTVGAPPQLVLYYSGWFQPFQLNFAKEAYAHHASVVIQIQPWGALSKITAGRYDKYLSSFAGNVRNFGHPVVIGFGHEMNGKWYKWGYKHQRPATFVAAWKHIVDVFRKNGADNVTWLWTISSSAVKHGPPLTEYYPGDKYVTWVGLDGYYYQHSANFTNVYGPAVSKIRKITTKPILLAESGIGQVAGQARMIPDLFAGIRQNHLLGLIWFDVSQHRGLYHQDWSLEGNGAADAAFRAGMASLTRATQA